MNGHMNAKKIRVCLLATLAIAASCLPAAAQYSSSRVAVRSARKTQDRAAATSTAAAASA